jgi:hypothetical protein
MNRQQVLQHYQHALSLTINGRLSFLFYKKIKKSAYNLDFYVKNEVVFILFKLYYGSSS